MLRGESTRQKLPLAEIINEPRASQHLFLSKKNERKLKKALGELEMNPEEIKEVINLNDINSSEKLNKS